MNKDDIKFTGELGGVKKAMYIPVEMILDMHPSDVILPRFNFLDKVLSFFGLCRKKHLSGLNASAVIGRMLVGLIECVYQNEDNN